MADHLIHHSPITESIIRGVKHNTTIYGAVTTLTLALTDNADPVVAGDNVVYTCQVNNTGTNPATSVSVQITLDAGLTYVSSSGVGWSLSYSSGVVTATAASLAIGAANPISVTTSSAINTALNASSTASASFTNGPTPTPSTQATTVKKVSKDATSGKYMPATVQEWTDFISIRGLAGVSAPTSIYLCQDAASPLVDASGGMNMAISGSGDTYQQAVTGWTAKCAKLTDGTTGAWVTSSASLPDISASSCTMLAYALVPSAHPAAARNMMMLGTTTAASQRIITTGAQACVSGGNVTNGATDMTAANTVRPLVLRENHTALTTYSFTDQEKTTTTHAAVTGKTVRLGSNTAAAGMGFLYHVRFDGSAAEISDANLKSLLQALGWTISWT